MTWFERALCILLRDLAWFGMVWHGLAWFRPGFFRGHRGSPQRSAGQVTGRPGVTRRYEKPGGEGGGRRAIRSLSGVDAALEKGGLNGADQDRTGNIHVANV